MTVVEQVCPILSEVDEKVPLGTKKTTPTATTKDNMNHIERYIKSMNAKHGESRVPTIGREETKGMDESLSATSPRSNTFGRLETFAGQTGNDNCFGLNKNNNGFAFEKEDVAISCRVTTTTTRANSNDNDLESTRDGISPSPPASQERGDEKEAHFSFNENENVNDNNEKKSKDDNKQKKRPPTPGIALKNRVVKRVARK